MEKLKELFDLKTTSVFVGTPAYFATITIDLAASRLIAAITITIGAIKLYEMFTGKKFSDLFKKK